MNSHPNLSNRELEIIQEIAAEYNTSEIGERLYLSHHTVMTHRKNILRKMGVRNVAGMIYQACRLGLLELQMPKAQQNDFYVSVAG